MSFSIQEVSYFYTTVEDESGQAYRILSQLTDLGVSLEAFSSVPVGPQRTQLTLFPANVSSFEHLAREAGMTIEGPHPAILIRGEDQLGALARVHRKLADADVNVFASTGLADGRGGYSYIIYVRPSELKRALDALAV